MAFDAGDIEAKLILDRSQFDREMAAAEKKAADFEKKKRKANVELDLDTDKAEAQLKKFMAEAGKNKDIKLALNIDPKTTQKNIEKFFDGMTGNKAVKMKVDVDEAYVQGKLKALEKNLHATLKVDADIDKINKLADQMIKVRAIVDHVEEPKDIGPGGQGGQEQTIKMKVKLDDAEAKAQANALVEELSKTINMDVELKTKGIEQVRAQLDSLRAYERDPIEMNVDLDTGAARAQLAELGATSAEVEAEVAGVGAAAAEGLGQFATYAAIAAAALPPISTALISIPALITGMAVPMLTVAMGMDGIKASAMGLVPAMGDIKNATSDTFQNGLEPAIERIEQLLPTLAEGFQSNAEALVTMGNGIAEVVASGNGIQDINNIMQDTATLVENFTPSVASLVANFLDLGSVGLDALQPIPAQMEQVSAAWDDVVATLVNSGDAKAAITSLVEAIVALVGAMAPLVQLGVQIMAAIGPALVGVITALGQALTVVAAGFSALPGPIQTAAGALIVFRLAMAALAGGGAAATAATTTAAASTAAMGTAAAAAATRTTVMSKAAGVLGSVVGGPMGAAVLGAVGLFSIYGAAVQRGIEAQRQAAASVKDLSAAFQASGGTLNNHIVEMIDNRAAALGMSQSLLTAGVSAKQLTTAVTTTATSQKELQQQIMATGNASDQAQATVQGLGQGVQQLGGITGVTGGIVAILGEGLGAFGTGAADASNNVNQLSTELTMAQQAAKDMAASQNVLVENLTQFGTTANTANLQAAALAASYAAITDDTKTAGEATQVAATYFALASDGQRNLAAANMASVGGLLQFKDAIDGAKKGLIDSSGAIDLMAKGGLELQGAVLQAAQGIDTLYGATLKSTGSIEQAGATAALARERFIEMGVAAGVPRANMVALADSMMAIPKEVKTNISTSGDIQAIASVLGFKDAIIAVPDNKSVIVKALTDEAKNVLTALGLQVTKLADGTYKIEVSAEAQKAQATLDKLTGFIKDGLKWIIPIGAKDEGARGVVEGLKGYIEGIATFMGINAKDNGALGVAGAIKSAIDNVQGTIQISAIDKGATAAAEFARATINSMLAMIGIDAEDRGATGEAGAIMASINGTIGVMGINAEDRGAAAVTAASKSLVDGTVGTMGINAADRGATAASTAMQAFINNLTGIMGINAADRGATAASNAMKSFIDGLVGKMGINAADRGALAVARGIVNTINGMVATIQIRANVAGAIAGAQAAARNITGGFRAEGGINSADRSVEFMAAGGIRDKQRLIRGLARARELPAGIATIVQPGTWRLIGDRSEDPEAYIPLNKSFRSRQLLKQAAERMGFGLVPLENMKEQGERGLSLNDSQWQAVMERARKNQGGYDQSSTDRLISAIQQAMAGRSIEHLTVQAPPGASVKEVVDEAVFQLRHARKGVHSR